MSDTVPVVKVSEPHRDAVNEAVTRFAEIVNERTATDGYEAVIRSFDLLAVALGGKEEAALVLWCLVLESQVDIA